MPSDIFARDYKKSLRQIESSGMCSAGDLVQTLGAGQRVDCSSNVTWGERNPAIQFEQVCAASLRLSIRKGRIR